LARENAGAGKDAPRGFGWDGHVRRLWQALEQPILRLGGLGINGRHEGVLGMAGRVSSA
jgi:hypothetical protein